VAIGTYSELQTAIGKWLVRKDLAAPIPDFITFGEAKLNRELRVGDMETLAEALTVSGQIDLGLPSDFLEMKSLYLLTGSGGRRKLNPFRTDDETDWPTLETTTGEPSRYSVVGSVLRFDPVPDAAYSLRLNYYAKIPALSTGSPTNWLLTKAPDLYLYACLIAGQVFTGADQRASTWADLYRDARDALEQADADSTPAPAMRSAVYF
jgi:hypothetical protein